MTLLKSLFGGIVIGLITVIGKTVVIVLDACHEPRYDSFGRSDFGLPSEWVGALFIWLFVAIVGLFIGHAFSMSGSGTRQVLRLLIFPAFYFGAGIGAAILSTHFESVPTLADCLRSGVSYLLTPWLTPAWLVLPICSLLGWMSFRPLGRQIC